MGNYDTQLFYM